MNVYDFDETVYAGECSIEFFLYCFRDDPMLIKFLPEVMKAFVLYKKEKITLDEMLGAYGQKLENYFSTHSAKYEEMVKVFWDKHQKKIKPLYLIRQKKDDVIITASPEFLMREICDRLGIENLICTNLDLKTGKITSPCFREAKTERFREKYPECKIDEFYTDSMNDRFLMDFAKDVYLVKGEKVTKIK